MRLHQIRFFKAATLLKRVVKDGTDWYKNIHNEHGECQLNKPRLAHEQVYIAILNLG